MNKSNMRIPFVIVIFISSLALAACGGTEELAKAQQLPSAATAVQESSEAPAEKPTEAPINEPTAVSIEAPPEPTEVPEPADTPVEVVTAFDADAGEFPEGIALDEAENIYVSLGFPFWLPDVDYFGEIRKISSDGAGTEPIEIDGPAPAGMAIGLSGDPLYAYPSGDPDTQGVYRLTTDGSAHRLPGTDEIILANGVAVDEQGDIFISDSILGAVWRVSVSEPTAEIWFQHEWLAGCPEDPIGANGIAFWGDSLYVASTVKGLLVNVAIEADGSAGMAELIAGEDDCDAEFDQLDSVDGIALDEEGAVYALLVMQNKLVRIDPSSGAIEVLLTGDDGLHNPASLVFGSKEENRSTLFFTNFAVLPPAPENSLGPGVLRFDVGVPGLR